MGWDAGDAALGVPMAALPGVTWRDVMTYCENQWMSRLCLRRDHITAPIGAASIATRISSSLAFSALGSAS